MTTLRHLRFATPMWGPLAGCAPMSADLIAEPKSSNRKQYHAPPGRWR